MLFIVIIVILQPILRCLPKKKPILHNKNPPLDGAQVSSVESYNGLFKYQISCVYMHAECAILQRGYPPQPHAFWINRGETGANHHM